MYKRAKRRAQRRKEIMNADAIIEKVTKKKPTTKAKDKKKGEWYPQLKSEMGSFAKQVAIMLIAFDRPKEAEEWIAAVLSGDKNRITQLTKRYWLEDEIYDNKYEAAIYLLIGGSCTSAK